MKSETLYGLDKPDELKELELKDASLNEILKTTYNAWRDIAGRIRAKRGLDNPEPLYRNACQIIEPFKEKLTGNIRTDDFDFSRTRIDFSDRSSSILSGIYFGALLNETKIEKLTCGKVLKASFICGYRLKTGKIIELTGDIYVGYAGRDATGGIGFNYSNMQRFGYKTAGGLWLNYGKIRGLGDWARGGILITKTEPEESFLRDPKGLVYGIGPEDLENDERLSRWIEKIDESNRDSRNTEVRVLARLIDEHVRENYEPRKIA